MLRDYSIEQLSCLVKEYYEIEGQVKQLGGYTDRNYLIVDKLGHRYILKISSYLQNSSLINIQNIVLTELRHFVSKIKCKFPQIIKTKQGHDVIILQDQAKSNHIRLFNYIEGKQIWEIDNPPTHLFRQAGSLAGRLSIFLQALIQNQQIQSNISQGDSDSHYFNICTFNQHYAKYINYLDQDIKGLVDLAKQQFNQALPALQTVPKQLIHNDICLSNLLVSNQQGQMFISGLIDFSSMIYTYRIIQLVILCARINLYQSEPLRNILIIVQAYNCQRQLSKAEQAVLFPLIKMRLAFLSLLSCYLTTVKNNDTYFAKCKQGHIHYLKTIYKSCQNQEFGKLLHNACSIGN